jgi:Tfp pilus assembly protein PilF
LKKHAFRILLLSVLVFLSYANTLSTPFHHDDIFAIKENRIIRDLGLFFSPFEATAYQEHFEYPTFRMRYITYLTFALNYRFHGLQVTGYHLVNIIIHITNSVLVYLLILLTYKTPFLRDSMPKNTGILALCAALLFASHPLATHAVTFTWQRCASLAALFYLLSLTFYARWRLRVSFEAGGPGRKRFLYSYLLSVLCSVIAMKTKELAITLPFIIVLYEVMFFEGTLKKKILPALPFFASMLIVPIGFIGFDTTMDSLFGNVDTEMRQYTVAGVSRWEYLFTQFRVIITYLRLLFFPVNQNFLYDYPIYGSFFHLQVIASFIILSAILLFGVFLFSRHRRSAPHTRLISFGILWFFVTLSVESSVIPIIEVAVEYRMYLPSAGAFMAIGASMGAISERLGKRVRGGAILLAVAWVTVVVTLFGATHERNRVYRDRVILLEDTLRKSPLKTLVNYNLGLEYDEKGLLQKARERYLRTIELDPSHYKARNNLGTVYFKMGRYSHAVEKFASILEVRPEDVTAHINLGRTYLELGKPDAALEHLKAAVVLNPYYPRAHSVLGNIYLSKGAPREAEKHFKTSLKLKPDSPSAYFGLGNAYQAMGKKHEAVQYYRRACGMGHGKSCGTLVLLGEHPRD